MARFARNDLGITKVAILRDVRSDYSVGLARAFEEAFEGMEGRIVADEAFVGGETDFTEPLRAVRKAEPEAIYIPGYHLEVARIATQARQMGIAARLLGGDGWDPGRLLEAAGTALEGSFYTNHYHAADPRPEVQRFVAAFEKEYNESPDALAALGYDAARVALDAIRRAGTTDPAPLRDAIAKTKNLQAVTGTITFDAKGNAKKAAIILTIENGKPRLVTRIADGPD